MYKLKCNYYYDCTNNDDHDYFNVSSLIFVMTIVGTKSPASCMELNAEQPMVLHLIPRPNEKSKGDR